MLFLVVQQGRQTSLHVVRGYSGFHSSRGNQAFSGVEGEFSVLSNCGRNCVVTQEFH